MKNKSNRSLKTLLRKLEACAEAQAWVGKRDMRMAWAECPRADWMLWLLGKCADQPGWPTHPQVVLAACACAETALAYVPAGEDRPRQAIEAARRWTRGEATLAEVRTAANAAATYAAYAAYAYAANAAAANAAAAYATYAAYAAYAYVANAAAADADAAAAYAYVANAAAAAANAAAREQHLATLADVVRDSIALTWED